MRSADRIRTVFLAVFFWCGLAGAAPLLNLQCGDSTTHAKAGVAAIGFSGYDFWNQYSRTTPSAKLLTNLCWADGQFSGIGLSISNALGSWNNGYPDELGSYLHPFTGGDIVVHLANVPPGRYDLLVYGHGGPNIDSFNGVFTVNTAGQHLGPLSTATNASWHGSQWVEGAQYVRFQGVKVAADGELVIACHPGGYQDMAVINGFQLLGLDRPEENSPDTLINIQFCGNTGRHKSGAAAFGKTASDTWNFYSRDWINGYKEVGTLNALAASDGTWTGASMIISNATGAWGLEHPDPMFNYYLYPLGSDHTITVRVNDLSPGIYDLYLYGHGGPDLDAANSIFKAQVSGDTYGPKATVSGPGWTNLTWIEGQQYVVLRDVRIAKIGDPLMISVLPGAYSNSFLNGIQIAKKAPYVLPSNRLVNIQFSAAHLPRKKGRAAVGGTDDDQWNQSYSATEGASGALTSLILSDGTPSGASVTVTNATAIWANGMKDPMGGYFVYSKNREPIYVTLAALPPGTYGFFLYGHGGPGLDKGNSVFSIAAGKTNYGPVATGADSGWKSARWTEGAGYAAIHGVTVGSVGEPVVVKVESGAAGTPFLSGMQIVFERPATSEH